MGAIVTLFALFLNPVPTCCDTSGSWCDSDYGPAVVAGQCRTIDGELETNITMEAGDKLTHLFWDDASDPEYNPARNETK